jgi:hypothetical protein
MVVDNMSHDVQRCIFGGAVASWKSSVLLLLRKTTLAVARPGGKTDKLEKVSVIDSSTATSKSSALPSHSSVMLSIIPKNKVQTWSHLAIISKEIFTPSGRQHEVLQHAVNLETLSFFCCSPTENQV